jgi:hypothetical protein
MIPKSVQRFSEKIMLKQEAAMEQPWQGNSSELSQSGAELSRDRDIAPASSSPAAP